MKNLTKTGFILLVSVVFFGCKQPATSTSTTTTTTISTTAASTHDRLGKATREDKNGWVYVHLAGSPSDIGFQHGYLLAKEIDTLIKVMQFYLPHTSKKDWAFYRAASKRFM